MTAATRPKLTDDEHDVLSMFVDGYNRTEIAEQLKVEFDRVNGIVTRRAGGSRARAAEVIGVELPPVDQLTAPVVAPKKPAPPPAAAAPAPTPPKAAAKPAPAPAPKATEPPAPAGSFDTLIATALRHESPHIRGLATEIASRVDELVAELAAHDDRARAARERVAELEAQLAEARTALAAMTGAQS